MLGSEKVDIEIRGWKVTVEIEGYNQLEVSALAAMVNERMDSIAKRTKVADSFKLAVLAALDLAAELQKLNSRIDDFQNTEKRKLDGIIVDLEKSLEPE